MDELKPKKPGRGRETLYRVAYNHQSQLVQIADYKANMIITVCTMIISAIIAIIGYGSVSGAIESYSALLTIPVAIIVTCALVSLVFAIQAARPKLIESGKEPTNGEKASLLFFGNIARYSQKDYLEKLRGILDEEEMYDHMSIDIYHQGVILKRKYNLLVYAYKALMYGFIFSVVFFLAVLLFGLAT